MRKAAITLLLLLTSSALTSLISSGQVLASPNIIKVPENYATIQMAINNANVNDTILVTAGTYNENLVVNQNVTLMGSGSNQTFIKALNSAKPVVDVRVNNVNLTGFTIQGGTIGVTLSGCNGNRIIDNKITSNRNQGVYLNFSNNNVIANNTFSLNRLEGMFLFWSNSSLIVNNVVTKNAYTGIDLIGSDKNRISNNTISFHSNQTLHSQGIWLDTSNNNTVDGNILLRNAYGIDMIVAANNTIYGNIIAKGYQGVDLDHSDDNTFYHNDFLNNTQHVSSSESGNIWDNGFPSGGNYWTGYLGVDFFTGPFQNETGSDGIGDTPYVIDMTNNDTYPLMNRWAPTGLDITPPVTTDDYDGLWHSSNFTITLVSEDFSGIKDTYYRINDAQTVSNVSVNGQPLITMERADNKLEYWSVDNSTAENEEPHKILTDIKLDKTPPYGSMVINGNDTYATSLQVTLDLFGNDSVSGISQMRFSNDEIYWSQWQAYSTTKIWSLSASDGLKTAYVQFSDAAGWVSQTYSDTIFLDTTSPTISIGSPVQDAEVRSSQVTVEWIGVDIGVGIDHYEIRIDNGSWISVGRVENYTFTGLTDGFHTVDLKAFDILEHESEESVSFVVNTSPIGGPGYVEEAVIIVTVIVISVVAAALYVLRLRKKRATRSESDLSA